MASLRMQGIDRALQRYRTLTTLLEYARERALSAPLDPRNVDSGLVEVGTKIEDARININNVFDELTTWLTHVAILDMCAAFEAKSQSYVGNAIGEARAIVKQRYKKEHPFYALRKKLIKEPEEFEGLGQIQTLFEGHASEELLGILAEIRQNRNRFAHGGDFRSPPTITTDAAFRALAELIELMR